MEVLLGLLVLYDHSDLEDILGDGRGQDSSEARLLQSHQHTLQLQRLVDQEEDVQTHVLTLFPHTLGS